jgi:Ser/Thr protein kinase RdoA (MazF antagonist)
MPATDSSDLTPYSTLTPDCVLNALDSLGDAKVHADGRLLALNSYENRVYQVGMEEGPPLVAKFYRSGRWTDRAILEEHAFVEELAAQELPVVAPLRIAGATLHFFAGQRFAVFPRRGGRAPELDDRATLEWLGRLLGRIHAIGALRSFADRPQLDVASFGEEPRNYLLDHGFIPDDLLDAWRSVVDLALDGVRRCYAHAGQTKSLRLHGDCHAGNILWNSPDASASGGGPHFVDFDDARMGPAVQDLWMLLSGERESMERQLAGVLAGYRRFHDFDTRELHLVEALRTLRLIHYAGWLARRWDDPAFPRAFPWFNTQRYWQDRILELREQIALMEEAPLFPAE